MDNDMKDRLDKSKGCGNMEGWKGKRKSYFKGKHKKHKKSKKTELQLDVNELVVYKSAAGRLFKGVVTKKCDVCTESCYVVKPEADSHPDREDHVSLKSAPNMIKNLTILDAELVPGTSVLCTWQVLDDGFVECKPAIIVDVHEGYCWLETMNNDLVRVGKDEICKSPVPVQIINPAQSATTTNHQNVNVIRLVLHATQAQLNTTRLVYDRTKSDLENTNVTNLELGEKTQKLDELLQQSLGKIEELNKQLSNAVTATQKEQTLYMLITEQKDILDTQAKHIIALEKTILDVRQEFQAQKEEINLLKNRVNGLQNTNQELSAENNVLSDRNAFLAAQQQATLRPKPEGTHENQDVVMLRGEKKKSYQSFIRINKPTKTSKTLDKKMLKRRADKLHEASHLLLYMYSIYVLLYLYIKMRL